MSAIKVLTLTFLSACLVSADHAGHDHGEMDMGSGSGSGSGSGGSGSGQSSGMMSRQAMQNMPRCVKSPNSASCQSYEYPDNMARKDIAAVCDAMPFMIACGLWDACENGELPDSPYCEPFVVLATACKDEGMSGMDGCASYTSMCGGRTRVDQCSEQSPVPNMLQTTETQV